MKIIILLPTRDRAKAFQNACQSIERTISVNNKELEFEVVVVDSSSEENHIVNRRIMNITIKSCSKAYIKLIVILR